MRAPSPGHILEKKGQHLLREKSLHFFHFQGKKGTFFHFQGVRFFHVTLMLMHEMPKIGPAQPQIPSKLERENMNKQPTSLLSICRKLLPLFLVKTGLPPSKKIGLICFNESPLGAMYSLKFVHSVFSTEN